MLKWIKGAFQVTLGSSDASDCPLIECGAITQLFAHLARSQRSIKYFSLSRFCFGGIHSISKYSPVNMFAKIFASFLIFALVSAQDLIFVSGIFIVMRCEIHECFYLQCESDFDCPVGLFCHEKVPGQQKICNVCYKCESRFHRENARDKCAKTADECGQCLDGYYEEVLAGGHKSQKCLKTSENVPDYSDYEAEDEDVDEVNNEGNIAVAIGIVVGVCLLSIILAIGIVCAFQRMYRKDSEEDQSNAEEGQRLHVEGQSPESSEGRRTPPPPYEQRQESVEIVTETVVVATPQNDKTEATPFNIRGYRRHLSLESDEDVENEATGPELNIGAGALEFEGTFELELINNRRVPDVDDDVNRSDFDDDDDGSSSAITEPSHWNPK